MQLETSVKIRKADGVWSILVNGEEMNMHIGAGGVTVTNFDSEYGTAEVRVTLLATDLDIEVDDAETTLTDSPRPHVLSADCWCGPTVDKVESA